MPLLTVLFLQQLYGERNQMKKMGLAPAHQGQEKLFTLGPQGPLATKQPPCPGRVLPASLAITGTGLAGETEQKQIIGISHECDSLATCKTPARRAEGELQSASLLP